LRRGLASRSFRSSATWRRFSGYNARSRRKFPRARRSIELDPDLAEGHHALGLSYTQLGRVEQADASFARAAELDPESYFRPFRLGAEDFDEVVDEALAELPEEFESYLDNVEVAIEDVPDKALVKEGSSSILGLYQGDHSVGELDFPDRSPVPAQPRERIAEPRESHRGDPRHRLPRDRASRAGMDEDAVRQAERRSRTEYPPFFPKASNQSVTRSVMGLTGVPEKAFPSPSTS
jgi:tetratricopeptide (TPR) repeat protein